VEDTNLSAVADSLKRPLVVVADDNFDIRCVVRRTLENLGYGVIAVENGEEAWQAVQRFRPEIALLDGLMPKADGREISKRIKEDPALDTKTVIMTSLYTSPAQKDEAFREYRVDGYLAKPVKAEVLKDTLAGLLRGPTAPESPV
jgi:CheY-like chemotaxis protein